VLANYRNFLTLRRDGKQYPQRAGTVSDCLQMTRCDPKILRAPDSK
jgi:hypothetical protein